MAARNRLQYAARRLTALALVLCLVPCIDPTRAETPSEAPINFEQDVRPLLARACLKCHGKSDPEGGLDLTQRETATDAGAIVPGDAKNSELVRRILTSDPGERMPPSGDPLTPSEVDLLQRWIQQGAAWPSHWAYRPLVDVPLPTVQSEMLRDWRRNPVDDFIAHRLEDAGLAPSPEADRRTLLRRLTFDLTGMPPTADAIEEFQNDAAPDAYERRVDELLASPHYGERAARFWIDLIRFAESHGQEQDVPRDYAWPYRDYLIRRFNHDAPYRQFILEQIAGDVLSPSDPWATVATGFLAAGPWDQSSLVGTGEDSIERLTGHYMDRDDIVTTVMTTFASTSVHCARCHDHKFDPITQQEYFSLQAVFAGTDKGNRKYDPDPALHQRRQQLLSEQKTLAEQRRTASPALLDSSLQQQAADWEVERRVSSTLWSPADIANLISAAGATLTPLDESSFRSEGTRPDKDTYTFSLRPHPSRLTALRLETLRDDSLPAAGPGRADSGNFVLNELRVFHISAADPSRWRPVALARPQADFSQPDFPVDGTIDGNPNTGWAVAPEVGKSHHATFELAEPLDLAPGDSLRLELHQTHGAGHLIGQLRIWTTDSPAPNGKPEIQLARDLSMAFARPVAERADDHKKLLAGWVHDLRLQQDLQALPPQSFLYCGTDDFEPVVTFRPARGLREVRFLKGGLITSPGEIVEPGALSCVEGAAFELPTTSAKPHDQRREALARWLADDQNVLVWRSIANRYWQLRFGQGLVETANDFGQMGAPPSHPELLDWLAVTLRQHGGSLKALDRLLVTSAAYRQSSQSRLEAAAQDAGNKLVWRMNRRRLDAEQFHDALLVATKSLDMQMEGPSIRQFHLVSSGGFVQRADYSIYDPLDRGNHRRSIYRFLYRSLPDPLMNALDCPDASQLTAKRTVSLTALQALATLNDKFVIRQSELLAEQMAARSSAPEEQVAYAFQTLLGRSPEANETLALADYVRKHGLQNASRILINMNEFHFLD